MPSRCHQSIVPYRSMDACLESEPESMGPRWDPSGGMGNAAMAEQLAQRGDNGNFAQHGITPADRGGFGRRLALTFDDGPDVEVTPVVLDLLKKYEIQATFFVHGEEIDSEEAEALLRRMRDEGHIVANHGERHDNFRIRPEGAKPSIQATHERLSDVNAPWDDRYYRFPGGNANERSIRDVEAEGYGVVGWHADSNDWCYNDEGAVGSCGRVAPQYRNDMVANVLNEAERYDGGILLFHDNRAYTAERLEEIILALQGAGFTFTNLDDAEVFPLLNSQVDQLTPPVPGPLGPDWAP